VKLYGRCLKKAVARERTIIRAYRTLTGLESIGEGFQAWTLCGPMSDGHKLQPNCELLHMLRSGLITSPSQFHGVERVDEYHKANVAAASKSHPGTNLYHGEMHTVLRTALARGVLHPAIVNLDSTHEPAKASRLLGETLHVLNHVAGPKMVVLNFVLDNPQRGRHHSFDKFVAAVQSDDFCRFNLGCGWLESNQGFVYNGTGKSSFKMGTVIYYQPYREAALAG
jgi:hypothetical protein